MKRHKKPSDLVETAARQRGWVREGDGWRFPDGAVIRFGPGGSWKNAVETTRAITARYGTARGEYVHGAARPGRPVMSLDRLRPSRHARQRWAQMSSEAGLDSSELVRVLRLPVRVVWSEKHSSWVWVGERIAVPVIDTSDGLVVTTVLWSTHELWDAHPRKETA